MAGITLGLDLGSNSIGWALVDEVKRTIIATGVRVFPEGVENFNTKKEKSKTEARRTARGMRRQLARRARRKRKLRAVLREAGLLPTDAIEAARLDMLDPYDLRRRAISENGILSPHEIGRVLVHLNQRRGFFSNRKGDKARKAENKGMLAEISELEMRLQKESKTLGEHLAELRADPHERIRGMHTRRSMLESEFETIWNRQRQYHPALLTDELKMQLFDPTSHGTWGRGGLIFGQRKLKPPPKEIVGRCELEPRRARCPRADRAAQRFRLLQEVNNLKYIDPDSGEVSRLTTEARTLLLNKLSRAKEMDFDKIRKTLGFVESVKFNLEEGGRKKLKGLETDALLAGKAYFGLKWHELDEDKKDAVVRSLIFDEDEQIAELAQKDWGIAPDVAIKIADELPAGYLHLSRFALDRLLPHMEAGLLYMTDDATPCALTKAGYLRADQQARRILSELPEPPEVANPVVRQALHEVRKVVNAILREYGAPNRINVELAREIKLSAKGRQEASAKMREREQRRDNAAEAVRAAGVKVTRDAIDRYLLWEEQHRTCIYSGRSISLTQLLGGEVDIDHVLPYSRCLDNFMDNKVVAFRTLNAEKGNRMPWEWLGEADPARFEQVRQRVASLPFRKRARFTQKALDLDAFITRQLNDTRYISRAVADYVRCLVKAPHHVLCPRGNHTAELRRHWGLNEVLRLDDVDMKNRDDHRHHAVDAIVLAFTDSARLQHLARIQREGGSETTGEVLAVPWEGFREQVKVAVNRINVSHRVQRKVSGALHQDTNYGPTANVHEYVVRKPIQALTVRMVRNIRDRVVRETIIARLVKHGIDPEGKGSIPVSVWEESENPLGIPGKNGPLIKRVRIIVREESIQRIRQNSEQPAYVLPSSNHHVEIFEYTAGKAKGNRDGVIVSTLDAARRLLAKQPVINRNHGDGKRFIMSLSINEIILVEMPDAKQVLHRVQKMDVNGGIILRPLTYAGKVSDIDKPPLILRRSVGTLQGQKVTVDPLGRVRWAND